MEACQRVRLLGGRNDGEKLGHRSISLRQLCRTCGERLRTANRDLADAIEYVIQHGSACSFFGPVAKTLGLSDGTTVDYRVLSALGDPKRDFYVTNKAVVLSMIWKSGASREYTSSKEGLLIKTVGRNTAISPGRTGDDFEAEKYWWSASISAGKRTKIGSTPTIDCAN
jgi:hypothetical protein